MKLGVFSGTCDICGLPRGGKVKHDICAKKRKAQTLPLPTEAERLYRGHKAQQGYASERFKTPD